MKKSTVSDVKNQIKDSRRKLKDMNVVAKARIQYGTDNKTEVLNHLISKYGEEKGNKLVSEYWNSFEK